MFGMYILKDKIPVLVEDPLEWGSWYEIADRFVMNSQINDNIRVSTVFLGLDHSHGGPRPLLFETAVITYSGGHELFPKFDIVDRYTTWEEAEQGHLETVDVVLDLLKKEKEVQQVVDSLLKEFNPPKL